MNLYKDLESNMEALYKSMALSGKMVDSHHNVLLRFLFKKGDHRLLKNWRPVSLLNVDYQILSKMTIRLGEVMGKLTPIEQKCGVKGKLPI